MVKDAKKTRRLAFGVALALVLSAAVPAVAETPSWSSWWASGLELFGDWWSDFTEATPRHAAAPSEVTPDLDPNGASIEIADPHDSLQVDRDESPDGEVAPDLDPNG